MNEYSEDKGSVRLQELLRHVNSIFTAEKRSISRNLRHRTKKSSTQYLNTQEMRQADETETALKSILRTKQLFSG